MRSFIPEICTWLNSCFRGTLSANICMAINKAATEIGYEAGVPS